jgi:predicted O-methyltransferase YrrM
MDLAAIKAAVADRTTARPEQLDVLAGLVREVVAEGVPGDLVECGVWRGGAALVMRAALEAAGDNERTVWLADSFAGPPPPDTTAFPEDARAVLWAYPMTAASRDEVEQTFREHGLLDDRICFLPGWFRDTLPQAPIGRISLLHVDGWLYESTFLALEHLHPKLSPGGVVVVATGRWTPWVRRAVRDFRADHGIVDPLSQPDDETVMWRTRHEA